jgi:hypothetical protein
MLANLDAVVGFLEEHGFSTTEALEAYSLVSSCAVARPVARFAAPTSPVTAARSGRRCAPRAVLGG